MDRNIRNAANLVANLLEFVKITLDEQESYKQWMPPEWWEQKRLVIAQARIDIDNLRQDWLTETGCWQCSQCGNWYEQTQYHCPVCNPGPHYFIPE